MPIIRSTPRPSPQDAPAEGPDAVPAGMRIAASFSWRLLIVAAALAVVVALVVVLQDIVVPFLIALLLCALLAPISAFLQRHRWPKWTAVLSSLVVLVLAIGTLALVVTAQIRYDLPSLEHRLHRSVLSLQTLLDSQPFGITVHDVNSWVSKGTDYLQAHASSILSGFQAAGSSAVHALEGLFIVVFTTLFVLIDGRRIWGWVVRLFPRRARARIGVAGEAGEDFGLLYGPDAVVLESLCVVLLLELGGLGGLPSFGPIRGELLDEGSLDGCGGELWPGGIGGDDLCEDEGGEGGCDGGLHCGDGDDGSSSSSSSNRVW